MRREEVKALYYITPIENLGSILKYGILSYTESKKLKHETVAMPEIQDRRRNKSVPGGKPLHDFVNLYFNPRNPMMYKLKDILDQLCVLIVHHKVLDIKDTIVTDMNASRDIARFESPEKGLALLDKKVVYAKSWDHADPVEKDGHKGRMCAEALVLRRIEPKFIIGAMISCEENLQFVKSLAPNLEVTINKKVFFA